MNGRRVSPMTSAAGVLLFGVSILLGPAARAATEHPLLEIMQGELDLSREKLVSPDGTKPYFLQYTVTDQTNVHISATLGSITANRSNHSRVLDVDVRCGDYALDNTHQIRGEGYWGGFDRWGGSASLPLNGDLIATRHAIWLETDRRFRKAVKRLGQVKANVKVKVEEEDPSDDFSHEEPSVYIGPWVEPPVDQKVFTAIPQSPADLQLRRDVHRAFVESAGSQLRGQQDTNQPTVVAHRYFSLHNRRRRDGTLAIHLVRRPYTGRPARR